MHWTSILAVTLLAFPAAAADPLDELAKRLVNARADVESLQSDLAEQQTQHGQRLRSLAGQRMELEAAVQREELKVRRLERTLAAARARQLESSVQAEELEPIARATIETMRARVRAGLPFQVAERLASLDELERHLVQGTLPPARVLSRLWAFAEDEVRLASETGLHQQTITLDGQQVLADVAKVGMVMLYFRTGEQFGYAVRAAEGWEYQRVEGGGERDQVRNLFVTLDKKIRTGFFELPNPRGESR